jgi:transposase InsO family protein
MIDRGAELSVKRQCELLVAIERPNQVWATDISYIPMAHRFLNLTAILHIFSRKVLAWRLCNTLKTVAGSTMCSSNGCSAR